MTPKTWLTFAFASALLLPSAALARKTETGFLDRTVTAAGETYHYQVFVPETFDRSKKWPVILFLHGSGERGDNGRLQTDVGLGRAIRQYGGNLPFVVVMPQCRSDDHINWTDAAMENQALAALDAAIKEFHGDRTRIYLTGLSMGGYGTWDLAAKYPGRFAAYVPICGGIRAPADSSRLHVALVDDPAISDPYAETAKRIGKTPVWIFHGADDPAVPVDESRKMAAALQAAGGNMKYTEYPGTGHNSWDKAYAETGLIDWLLAQHLNP
jgi:predicted peptidase